MTMLLGHLSLGLAALLAVVALAAAIGAGRSLSPLCFRVARAAMALLVAALTLSSLALMAALLQGDFRIEYVASYTERALPTGYKIAAFWAGQAGSLLLWSWVLAVMSLIAIFTHRRSDDRMQAGVLGTLALVCGFFACLMLFAANPFAATGVPPADGHGLNPMLQNPGMIAHPPLLFLGYAAFTIPFAFMVGSLLAGHRDPQWVSHIRRWSLLAWLFLSVGIVLGAQWAYVELGWGGYWAWDPVENASLLPWLTATAYLHTLAVEQRRGMFRFWNVSLIAMTFILCIFGTYLTRSGVIQSVHGFEKSLVGTFFLAFLVLITGGSVGIILWRLKALRSEHQLESLLSREGAFLMGNVLLVAMMAATLVGTIFPLLSGLFGQPISVSQPFYNKLVVPMALVVVALMSVGPLLTHGADAARKLLRGLLLPGLCAIVAVAIAWALGMGNGWALLSLAIIVVALSSMGVDLFRAVRERTQAAGEKPMTAFLRLVDHNHRRYGGQLTHLGVVMIVAGVAGSSLFSVNKAMQLSPGGSERIGRYTIRLDSLQQVRRGNFTAIEARLSVITPGGRRLVLQPQRRFYDKAREANSEVAIDMSFREDLYVTLAGWEDAGRVVAIQAIINPLVSWIWIGGVTLSLGALLCLLPRWGGQMQEIPAAAGRAAVVKTLKLRPTAEVMR